MIFRDAVNSAAILMRTVYLTEQSNSLAIYFVAASFPLIVVLRVFRERRRRVGFVLDMMFAYHQEELEHDYQTLETVLKEMVPAGVAGKLVQRVRGERRGGKASHLNGVVVDDAAGAGEAFFALESSTSDSSSGGDGSTTSSDENPVGGGASDDAASSSDKQTTTTTNNTTTSTMNNPLGGFLSAHNDNEKMQTKKKKRRRRRHRGEQQQQQRKRKIHPMWSASGNLEMDEVPFLLLQLSTCTTGTTGSKEHRGAHRHRLSEPKSRGTTPAQVQPQGSANSVGGLAFYEGHSTADDEGDAHRSSTNNNSSSTATDDDHANGTDSSGADSEAAAAIAFDTWGADDYDDGAAAAAGGGRALDRELNRLSLLAILHDAIPAVFTNEQKRTVQLVQCTHDTAMLVALPQGAGSDDQDELRAFDLLTTANALFKHLEEYFTNAPNTTTTTEEEVADSPQENAMELLSPKHSGQSQPQPQPHQQKRQSSSLSQQHIPSKKLLLPCRMLLDVGGAMGAVLGGRSSVSFGYHGGVVHQAVEALAELPWGTYAGSKRFIALVQQHKTFHNASRDHWNAVTEREPPFFGALFYPKMTPTSPFNDDDWGGKEANLRQAA
ncbi:transmembrane protein, putative, partial [Bodo saltans]